MRLNRRRRAALAGMLLGLLPLAAAAEGTRILMLGDSLTAGYGLPPGQGLAPALQDWLRAHGTDATVIDAGLSGDTTYGGRVRIVPALLHNHPDAVIVELGGNDMLRGWPVKPTEDNLDSILKAARSFPVGGATQRPVLLVGLGAPAGPAAWRREWLAMWPRLRDRHGVPLLADLYAPLAAVPASERRAYLQADGVHPSPRGVEAMVPALGRAVQTMLAGAARSGTGALPKRTAP